MATEQRNLIQMQRSDMTPILQNASRAEPIVEEEGDIPITQIDLTGRLGGGNLAPAQTYPIVLPSNPTFTVPANPLLPPEYNEILDYNSIQYLNGIFRTQIGRYVRVQQLVGSNIIQDYDGFLIGVGINYIILQEYANANITILDIYGIKQMYVYYAALANPFTGTPEQ